MKNGVIKESGIATALRIVFAVIMVVTIGTFTNSVVLHNTLYSSEFLKKTIMSEDIKDAIHDEISERFKQYIVNQAVPVTGTVDEQTLREAYDLETGNEFADEMIDYSMDEVLGVLLDGDIKIDEDRFDEIFDEYGEEYFDELEDLGYEYSREDFLEAKEQLFEEINNSFSEIEDITEENGAYEYLGISRVRRNNIATMIVTGIINLILIVVLIIIHKNKFRPIRATGIAGTVTETGFLVFWSILWGIVKASSSAVDFEDELFEMVVKSVLDAIGTVILIFGIASLIAIALIIIGCVGAGAMNKVNAGKGADGFEPAYQAPKPQPAPAPQPVPVSAVDKVYEPQPVVPPVPDTWDCPFCGSHGVTGNFCTNCGAKRN